MLTKTVCIEKLAYEKALNMENKDKSWILKKDHGIEFAADFLSCVDRYGLK
jgi:hypothetical protein